MLWNDRLAIKDTESIYSSSLKIHNNLINFFVSLKEAVIHTFTYILNKVSGTSVFYFEFPEEHPTVFISIYLLVSVYLIYVKIVYSKINYILKLNN